MAVDVAALIVAGLALVVSAASAVYAGQIARLEKARRGEEVEASRTANVLVSLRTHDRTRDRLIIRNDGPATAHDVSVTDDAGRDRTVFSDAAFPLSSMVPGEVFEVSAALAQGDPIPYPVVVRWSDGRGSHERRMLLALQSSDG